MVEPVVETAPAPVDNSQDNSSVNNSDILRKRRERLEAMFMSASSGMSGDDDDHVIDGDVAEY